MRVVVSLLVALLSLSCLSAGYIDMQSVDAYGWCKSVSIIYDNVDTQSLRDISVAVRYNDYFEGDTLSVVIQTSLPDVHQCRERVLLKLERDYAATAVTASESVLYRSSCSLSQQGNYIFTITPCRTVKGIEAVGIEITK